MARNDIPVSELEAMYSPFEGEFVVTVDEHLQMVYVEDINGMQVCIFNRYTQLPMTNANMEWEFNFWIARAHQICNMLNLAWDKENEN